VNYSEGDNLTENKYSWHRESNLLFIESPPGVGYSYNTNLDYHYNDYNTANDNFNAVLDFFQKYPEYRKSPFFIAGESYAGKYIPDLAVLIDRYNLDASSPINFKGIMVGNGVMRYNSVSRNQVKYLLDRSFVDPEIKSYWDNSCQFDPDSAGCRFFTIRFQENFEEINPYNVYSYCYYNDSFQQPEKEKDPKFKRPTATQESILMNITSHFSNNSFTQGKYNGAPCSYFDGMLNYFGLHEVEYRAKWSGQRWNGPCVGCI
jgi:serine carboxypeptidase-like clade 2